MSDTPAPEKSWRQMTPKELVYTLVRKEKPELTEGTLKTYTAQLASFLKTVGAKTIGGAYQKTYEQIETALETVENANSKAGQLNAYLSVIKYGKIPMGEAKQQRLFTLNDKLRDIKMKPMEQGIGEAPPDGFREKVNAYLAKPETKGTREAVFIALMALAPTVRPAQFEDVRIARSQAEYDALKGEGQSVLGAFGDTYLLWTKPANRKVKTIDDPVRYTGKAVEALKAYLKPGQELLFPSYKGGTVKTQMIEKAIKKAFQDAEIGFIGAQKLRRIAETQNQADPSKSREEKEDFSKQMNHGRDMGDKYRVIKAKDVERTEEADLLYTVYGDRMAEIQTLMPGVESEETIQEVVLALEDVLTIIKGKPKKKVVMKAKPEPEPKTPELPKGAVMYRGKAREMPKEEPKAPTPPAKKGTVIYYGGKARTLG